ncbi:unnamed protein product [Pylaiella littoralis]
MKTLLFLALAIMLFCDRAYGYSLKVTACNSTYGGTSDDDIKFHFCDGGSYCIPGDIEGDHWVGLQGNTIGDGSTIEIAIASGYEPTTVEFRKGFGVEDPGEDSWCIAKVTWQDGDNLLGEDGYFFLEHQTASNGCIDGIADTTGWVDPTEKAACMSKWRFFNINAWSESKYDARVKACAGTSSSIVLAYFCSHSNCDGGAIGEEWPERLEMNDVEGGWTDISFSLPFNPLAVRLEKADGDDAWCADELFFNGYALTTNMTKVENEGFQIFPNIQENGQTPAPTPAPVNETASTKEESDDPKWLDAAWEVTVTVIGSLVISAGAGCLACAGRRARALHGPGSGASAHGGKGEGRTADVGRAKEQEERPLC